MQAVILMFVMRIQAMHLLRDTEVLLSYQSSSKCVYRSGDDLYMLQATEHSQGKPMAPYMVLCCQNMVTFRPLHTKAGTGPTCLWIVGCFAGGWIADKRHSSQNLLLHCLVWAARQRSGNTASFACSGALPLWYLIHEILLKHYLSTPDTETANAGNTIDYWMTNQVTAN